jgi:serine/threonine protein kinase
MDVLAQSPGKSTKLLVNRMEDSFPLDFGRYNLIERLAIGGMAELFRAHMTGAQNFKKQVVIKKILPQLAANASFVTMFIDEAKITAQLMHPKIVQVIELGQMNGELFIAMEYVEGVDCLTMLRTSAKRKQRLDPALCVHICHEVLDALDHAHNATGEDDEPLGIVHRDISPGNVLLSRKGHVKLTDFGIARAATTDQKTEAGTLKGKYGYMSPEQISNADAIDGRSDIFSVGVVLAEFLMGRRLFTAPSELDVLLMVRDAKLDRLDKHGSHIDIALRGIIERALQRKVSDRYADAAEFRDDLADWLYNQRRRVTNKEIATAVRECIAFRKAREEKAPVESVAAGTDQFPSSTTISGPTTVRRELEAQEAAKIGRAQFAEARGDGEDGVHTKVDTPKTRVDPPGQRADIAVGTGPMEALSRDEESDEAVITISPAVAEEEEDDFDLDIDFDEESAPSPTRIPKRASTDVREMAAANVKQQAARIEAQPKRPQRKIAVDNIEEARALTERLKGMERSDQVMGGRGDLPNEMPGSKGSFGSLAHPIKMIAQIAQRKQTGLLVVDKGPIHKQAFIVDGIPQVVGSNLARERLGEFLVASGRITEGELSMALSVLPQFGGRIGDTLVGLGLMDALDAFRALADQVRHKIADVCTWSSGEYAWYPGKEFPQSFEPLHLDPYDIIGFGAAQLDASFLDRWARTYGDEAPLGAKLPLIPLDGFRLGPIAPRVRGFLDGQHRVQDFYRFFTDRYEQLDALRSLFLMIQVDLAKF